MKKPRVIKGKSETVGEGREGFYWRWNSPSDECPDIVYKTPSCEFHASYTFQEHQCEVPEYPRKKTDKEKLAELIKVAEAVVDDISRRGVFEYVTELANLIRKLKEDS